MPTERMDTWRSWGGGEEGGVIRGNVQMHVRVFQGPCMRGGQGRGAAWQPRGVRVRALGWEQREGPGVGWPPLRGQRTLLGWLGGKRVREDRGMVVGGLLKLFQKVLGGVAGVPEETQAPAQGAEPPWKDPLARCPSQHPVGAALRLGP